MKAITSPHRKFLRRQRVKWIVKLKVAVIVLFVIGKSVVHFDLIEEEKAKSVDFGVEMMCKLPH